MKINKTDTIVESYAYDMFGNRIATTDALGNAVYKSYDPFGRVTAEWGATYPVRFTYDTQGRRTSLATTRDGATWDETTWTYDTATGLCTSKTYADGSGVAYTYTPDNLLLRTTYASGRWRENTYDTSRRLVAENFGGGSGGAGGSPADTNTFTYDVFCIRLSESNSVSSVTYQRDTYGNCTNETITVAGGPQSSAAAETYTIDREFDAHSRLVRHGDTYYTYAPDGLLATISNAEAVVEYAYTFDRFDAGYTLTLTNGTVFTRSVVRDVYRRSLVTAITNSVNGVPVETFAYAYDALGRPVTRNDDTFAYNNRSEIVSATIAGGSPSPATAYYGYDEIGNSTNFIANCLNQYTLCGSVPLCEFTYDADGNLLSDGVFTCAYDAANRLSSVTSNGVALAAYSYDSQGRRIRKVTPSATHTYFYDGWLLVRETLVTSHSSLVTDYVWGKDLSGTLQDAGGVGGLLYLMVSNSNSNSPLQLFIPFYDNNGNITRYCDAQGNVVAEYTYDAFGNTIAQSGPMADDFALRFSTKYYDAETGLYYYGYRYYHPPLMRWINRDPIEEDGGENLYAMCRNHPVMAFDTDGQYEWNEESARAKLHDTVREFRRYGWNFAADALESFVNGTERNVDLSRYSGDISSHFGWQQAFIESVSSKLNVGETNKRIGDIEHEANFGKDLSNENFNNTAVFNKQFEYRFYRVESGNLFYALYGSRYSYVGIASKTKEKVDGKCCTKIDLNLELSSWDALTYPSGQGRQYVKEYSAAMYLESLRTPNGNRNRFVPYIYLLWNENGRWVQCSGKYRGGTRTGFWKRK